MADMSNRHGRTVTHGNASSGVNGVSGKKVTRVGGHVSRGSGVHIPVATASVLLRRGVVWRAVRSAGSQGAGGRARADGAG